MNRILFIFLILTFNAFLIKAQSDSLVDITESNFILVTGAGYNGLVSGEIGLGSTSNTIWQDSSKYSMSLQHYIGSEFWFDRNQIIYAPKYTFFIGLKDYLPIPVTTGFSLLYASDLSKKAFSIRLEYGISIGNGRFFYSFNIPVYNENLINSYKHQLSFSWSFRIGKMNRYKTYYNKETDTYFEEDYE